MAQYDVMMVRDTGELVVDCQADLLRHLPTRVVAPLFAVGEVLEATARLNPTFEINGTTMLLGPQFMVSIPLSELGKTDITLHPHAFEIVGAIDTLLSGI